MVVYRKYNEQHDTRNQPKGQTKAVRGPLRPVTSTVPLSFGTAVSTAVRHSCLSLPLSVFRLDAHTHSRGSIGACASLSLTCTGLFRFRPRMMCVQQGGRGRPRRRGRAAHDVHEQQVQTTARYTHCHS